MEHINSILDYQCLLTTNDQNQFENYILTEITNSVWCDFIK